MTYVPAATLSGIVQEKLPEFGAGSAISRTAAVWPGARRAIRTLAPVSPCLVHWIILVSPFVQTELPFGWVTVMV
jgi:hypothetical protein